MQLLSNVVATAICIDQLQTLDEFALMLKMRILLFHILQFTPSLSVQYKHS